MNAFETGAMAAAAIGAAVALIGSGLHVRWMLSLPFKVDVAEPKGSVGKGIIYAFTLGMAPWEKESTRRHAFSYLRGVVFHVGIFAALLVFVLSPWLSALWPTPIYDVSESWSGSALRFLLVAATGLGGLAGVLGLAARFGEENLRALSTKDDYFSVALVSVFVLASSLALLTTGLVPLFHLASALTFLYLPFGKVRHCVYFFFSRVAFGAFFGRRGVIEKARGGL